MKSRFGAARALLRRYSADLTFRGWVSLLLSTAINSLYALFKLGTGIYYRSLWFGAVGLYYLLLAGTRAYLLLKSRGQEQSLCQGYRVSRNCGILLLVLSLALSAVALQMVRDGKGYHYPGSLIFAAAMYAFYAVTIAIRNLIRFRRLRSPVLSASKVLALATALVSMLSLQTAMFASFGEGFPHQRLMNALTGGGVFLLLFGMAAAMVVQAGRQIKRLKAGQGELYMNNDKGSFSYTYSATQQDEVRRIRQKYQPPEQDKMERLRKLDQSATRAGKIASLILGVLSTLVLGTGMCCTMVWTAYFVPGIVIGLIGMAGMGAAFPVYTAVTRRKRKKLAPQIMQLSQELLDLPE